MSFSLEKTSAHPHGTPAKAKTLRMSVDGVHGWILAPGRPVGFQLWRTSNAGWTWTRVPLAHRVSVLDVGGGKVWLAGREGSRARAWSASANATSASAFTRRLDVPTVAVSGITRTRRAARREGPGAELPPGRQPFPCLRRQRPRGSPRTTARPGATSRWATARCPRRTGRRGSTARPGWWTCTAIRRAAASAGTPRTTFRAFATAWALSMPSTPWSRVRAAQGSTGSAREARPQPLTTPHLRQRDVLRVHRLHQPVGRLRGDGRRQAAGLEGRRLPLARRHDLVPHPCRDWRLMHLWPPCLRCMSRQSASRPGGGGCRRPGEDGVRHGRAAEDRPPTRGADVDPLAGFSAATRAWFEGAFAAADARPDRAPGTPSRTAATPWSWRRPARARRWPRSCGRSTGSPPSRRRPSRGTAAGCSTSPRSRPSPSTSSATCARR